MSTRSAVPMGRPTYKFPDPRLPKLYPGCWDNQEWRKRYRRIYMKIMREGPYGKEEYERVQARRKLSEMARVAIDRCFSCGKGTTHLIVRNVEIDGRMVSAYVRYCGKC